MLLLDDISQSDALPLANNSSNQTMHKGLKQEVKHANRTLVLSAGAYETRGEKHQL